MAIELSIPWQPGGTATVSVAASTNPLLASLNTQKMYYDGSYNYWADILVHVEARIPGRADSLRFEAVFVHFDGPGLDFLSGDNPAETEAMERIAAAAGPAMDAAVHQRYVELVDEAVADGVLRKDEGIRPQERAALSRRLAALATLAA